MLIDDFTVSPLATRSGLIRPSSVGPNEEKELMFAAPGERSDPATASETDPTVITFLERAA